jgi:Uma2 family endonuclease
MSNWTETADPRFLYERAPQPLVFPEEAEVPESKRHLALRTILLAFLERAFGDRAAIGSEQFVYFDAGDPRRCVAPDAFVRLGAENDDFPTWKVWERGAPDVAVEIASLFMGRGPVRFAQGRLIEASSPPARSRNERPWADKLADYRAIGVRELVRFDPEASSGKRLRVWDRVEEDLVPRVVDGDRAASRALGGTWCVGRGARYAVALRLEDASGAVLPTDAEAERAAKEAERVAREVERARADREQERADAERARADALEAKLAALLAERDGAQS